MKYVRIGLMLGMAVVAVALGFVLMGMILPRTPHDNSDPPNGRSGLSIYTDNLTGCQYLRVGILSALTPRLDSEGKPVCAVRKDTKDDLAQRV